MDTLDIDAELPYQIQGIKCLLLLIESVTQIKVS